MLVACQLCGSENPSDRFSLGNFNFSTFLKEKGEYIKSPLFELSSEKLGKYTGGTQNLIISEEQFLKEKPDYFLVLPWVFLDEFYLCQKS